MTPYHGDFVAVVLHARRFAVAYAFHVMAKESGKELEDLAFARARLEMTMATYKVASRRAMR